MNYYSHVLHFPDGPMFKDAKRGWASFVGTFITPLVRERSHLVYWFSNYGTFARFRIWTDQYEELRPELEALRDRLGLVDRNEEKDLTLEEDLGAPRFIGPDTTSNRRQRALKILHSLHTVCELVIDSIRRNQDGSWSFELSGDPDQNPIGNHLFSVTHLYHNTTGALGRVCVFPRPGNGASEVLSYYYFWNAVNQGKIPAEPRRDIDILL